MYRKVRRSSLKLVSTPKASESQKKSEKKSDEKKSEEKKSEVLARPLFIADFLGELLRQQKHCDVEFIVGPADAGETSTELKIFKAHRLVLAAHSPLFKSMLYSFSKKTRAPSESLLQVRIKDTKPEMFQALLKAIYTDKVDVNDDNLEDLTVVGKKYHIEKIQLACASHMEKGMNVKNVCHMFENAMRLVGNESFGLHFIRENSEEIFKSESFFKLSPTRLKVLLADDKLTINETEVFDAVIKWGKAECKRQSKSSNLEDLKTILKDVLPLVRFPTIELIELAITVGPTKLLPEEHLLILYQYMSMNEEKDINNDKGNKNNDKEQIVADEKAKMECQKTVEKLYNIKPRTGGFNVKNFKLLDRKYKKDIYKFFNIRPGGRLVLKLLYRGSRDGFTAYNFHQKCDGKPKTLTVIKATNSKNIFGGYFEGSWAQGGRYVSSPPSWLYSLVNTYGKPVKLLPSSTSSNTYLGNNYGPTWGAGHDLHIHHNMKSTNNYSAPSTYRTFAPGYGNLGVSYNRNLFAETGNFTVDEIEVMQIVKITNVKKD